MISLLDIYKNEGTDIEHFLYLLVSERLQEGDANISHVKMPTWEEHIDFIKRRTYRAWYVIVNENDNAVGAVSITPNNEIGIVIRQGFRRQHYAEQALMLLMATHPPLEAIPSQRSGHYLANIRPGNAASIALFKSLGFTLLQHTYALKGAENAGV